MKYLVTGAAGFIGFHVTRALLARGEEVVGYDVLNDYYEVSLKEDRLKELAAAGNAFRLVRADLTDQEKLERIFGEERFERVCHLAAQTGVRYSLQAPRAYLNANVLAFLNVLEGCRRYPVRNLVYASSSSVYGGSARPPFRTTERCDAPVSLYAATKRTNELMAHAYHHLFGLKCTGLRFFTVYGPWGRPDMAVFKFVRLLLAGQPIDLYHHGEMSRDFTYIDDIVAGVLAALDSEYDCEIFNLGNSTPVKLTELVEIIEANLGVAAEKNLLPMQPGDVPYTCADLEREKKLLGYRPTTDLRTGIRKFVEWYRSYYGLALPNERMTKRTGRT